MRKGLKMVAFIIDVAFMPIRTLIWLEVVIASAILCDVNIKVALKDYAKEIKNYPNLVKASYKNIFKSEEAELL